MARLEPGVSLATRLADAAGSLLERRTSRRGVLARAAVAGSAMAVAPARYLLYPEPALAVVLPGDVRPGSEVQRRLHRVLL